MIDCRHCIAHDYTLM